jgi:hypothetical protein
LPIILPVNAKARKKLALKFIPHVAPDIAAALKNNLDYGKRTDIWHLVLLRKNVLFEESPPSIMVTRNPNWSTEILWPGIGYVKRKILSPLKRSA